jgi:hypothetical protein
MGIKVLRYVFDEITRDLISEKSKINNLFTESSANNKVEVIHYQKDQGLAIIPIEIDGFSVDVILDSGASSVSISKKLEKNLLDQGIISESDYIEPGLFRIADGSISIIRILPLVATPPACSIMKLKGLHSYISLSFPLG